MKRNKLRIFSLLGWTFAVVAACGCLLLYDYLGEARARERSLRRSTAGLENRRSPPAPSSEPVLLITGDSRAAQLGTESIGGYAVLNRGVPGQTTNEVLARIGRDMAVALPDQVIVIAGVNDLKDGVEDPQGLGGIARSFEEMLLIGDAMGISVVICPVWGASSTPSLRGMALSSDLDASVRDLNRRLDRLRTERSANSADLAPLLDENGLVRGSLAADSLHLNAAGLEILRKSLLESLDSIDGPESD